MRIKTRQMNVRLTAAEFEQTRKATEIEGMTISGYLRELLRAELRQKGLWPPAPPSGQAPAGGARC